MNRSRLLATALAVGFVAAGTVMYFAVGRAPRQERAAIERHAERNGKVTKGARSPHAKRVAPGDEAPPFPAPVEPDMPEGGSPARVPYLQAMIAGDENALRLARDGLVAAQAGPGPASPGHVRNLHEMERIYAERLARHQRALAESN